MHHFPKFILILLVICLLPLPLQAAEGMYPINAIHQLDLPAAGLEIPVSEIYNPDSLSLVSAIVKLGGCTGSFVSPQGLILTNHHCAFYAAQAASDAEHDYLHDGFIARTRAEEIPAQGFTVRITEAYRDISAELLSVVSDTMNLMTRAEKIKEKKKEMIKSAEAEFPGKKIEISEMFAGHTYVLFVYTYLKDIRLVYVLPPSIGEFGGDVDNWEWPRHTGDFAFMRAYVAPDGSSAEFSKENVPYQPQRFLQVAAEGVNENDFVFLLGYPGRSYRHRTSHFLAFEQEFRLPYTQHFYEWKIGVMQAAGQNDRAVAIQHAARIQSLSNAEKNYRGKLKSFRRLQVLAAKRTEEARLQAFIESDSLRREKYGSVLQEIGEVYADQRETAESEFLLDQLKKSVEIIYLADFVKKAATELSKPDEDRAGKFKSKNWTATLNNLKVRLKNFHEPTDRIFFKEILQRMAQLPEKAKIQELAEITESEKSIAEFLQKAYSKTRLKKKDNLLEILKQPPEVIRKIEDPFVDLLKKLEPAQDRVKQRKENRKGALDKLYARLLEAKQEFLQTDFVPDANRTLRFTYGHVRGYSPADAIHFSPITTVTGLLEKNTGTAPFAVPERMVELVENEKFGRFAHPDLGRVPVALLYDTDTTGGNSGSPIFNARGQLVGVNFDRSFEATINDYTWSPELSRSIGVDIRYILWVTQKFGGADFLLKEMQVEK